MKNKSSIFMKKKISMARDEDHEEFSFSKRHSKSKSINESKEYSIFSSVSSPRREDINLPSINLFKTAGLVESK